MRRQPSLAVSSNKFIAILATLTLLGGMQVKGDEPVGNAAKAVKTSCDEIVYLQQIKDKLRHEIAKALKHQQKLEAENIQFRIAAASATEAKQRQAYQILAAIGEIKAQRQAKTIAESDDQLNRLRDKFLAREFQVKTAKRIHKKGARSKKTATHGTPSANYFGSSTKTCTITIEAEKQEYTACKAQESSPQTLGAGYSELKNEKTLRLLKDGFFEARQMTLAAHAKGDEASASTQSNSKDCTDAGGDNSGATHGIGATLTLSNDGMEDPEAIGIFSGPGSTTCAATDPDANNEIVTGKGLAYALCKNRHYHITTELDVGEATVETLKTDPDAQAIATQIQNTGKTKDIKTADAEATAAILKSIFGSGDNDIKDKFITPLSNKDIIYKAGGADAKKSISAIAEGGEGAVALAYFYSLKTQAVTSEVKCEQKQIVDPQTGEKCKGKAQGECKDEDGCEFKGEKCQAKEGVKAEGNDAKTTNTTGSNSFVINKAPLLLAFLLF
uniref:Variant surface glycoprotein n=1 Tax=Trypanosoma brucei TaxID=5691 RepID=S5G7A0_9TRYP|nr:variant surface glycoprotein [Trypanosoma brucei]